MAAETAERAEQRIAWWLCAPALLVIFSVAVFPLAYTAWESLHLHDLRMPWRGEPFIGLGNYTEALGNARFRGALAHTAFFAAVSVSVELALGLGLALLLHQRFAARGLVRTLALLPWAMPTVVAALVFRFLFEPSAGASSSLLSDPILCWVPVLLADIWKTTPFVALLLLAGLQSIDPELYEAARIDGAGPWQTLRHVTLPSLLPAMLVACIFRTLDAFRVFDSIYVLTGGGPGTATESLALYTFGALMRDLRFGYGSALSMIVFFVIGILAFMYIRVGGRALLGSDR